MSWAEIKIAYLVSQLTITKIILNPEDNRSFLMKSMDIPWVFRNGELFERSI